jgi:carbamoyltransferase
MTGILGFNAFHADSAACLVVDGQLVGAVAEERLGERQKHSAGFCDWAWLCAAGATCSCASESVA